MHKIGVPISFLFANVAQIYDLAEAFFKRPRGIPNLVFRFVCMYYYPCLVQVDNMHMYRH